MQTAVDLAVSQKALAVAEADEKAAPDEGRAGRVAGVGVEQIHLDERDTRVRGNGVRDQRADSGPRAVRADEQIGGEACAIAKNDFVASVADWQCGADLTVPLNRTRG